MITKSQQNRINAYAKSPVEDQATFFSKCLPGAGMYWFMPVLGWIEPRDGGVPFMMLSGTILRISDQSSVGTGSWRIPTTAANTEAILVLLASLGWDGLVWPYDQGWPTGAPEEEGLKTLIHRVPLGNTFSFAPDPVKGVRVLRIVVTKSVGASPLPPDVGDDRVSPTEAMRARFAEAALDPTIFLPADYATVKRSLEGVDFTPMVAPTP